METRTVEFRIIWTNDARTEDIISMRERYKLERYPGPPPSYTATISCRGDKEYADKVSRLKKAISRERYVLSVELSRA